MHGKCLVSTTPEVVRGAPILAIHYSPDSLDDLGELAGPEPGKFGGWTFLHALEAAEAAGLYFFEQVTNVDPGVRTIIEAAVPGVYARESEFAPFEFEALES